jgi:valine--pyruvate aminotransferase
VRVQVLSLQLLANGNLGPALVEELLRHGEMDRVCRQLIQPYYADKRDLALGLLKKYLVNIPYRVHEAQGAFFLWLWFEGLPISSTELYERLKQNNVLVMDGKPFFFGDNSAHASQCIRISYCQDESVLNQALSIMAKELECIYQGLK